jgi:glycosyltransferase involved in cell wall biosynthesis
MRIGIEVQRLFRKKKFGIEFSSLELINNIRETAPNHEYVIFAKDDVDRKCLTPSDNLKIKIVGGKFFVDFEQFFLPLAARHEQVDILHCTGNTAPFFSPVPVIQTLHDVIFMDTIPPDDTFYQRFGNHYRRKVVPLVTPRSSVIITVSEFEKQRIVERLGIDPEKIHVVYNGINESRFHRNGDAQLQQSVRDRHKLPPEFILFLGNQSSRKNPSRLIEAYVTYARLCQNPLPLVTPGLCENFIVAKLNEYSYPFDARQFITPGYISDADLPVLYGLSKMFLFPSLSEGFGLPVIEAMACGAPVITSNTSCMPEIAGDAALLIDPLSATDMARAILAYSENEELRRKKIEAGLLNVKRFSWNRAAEYVLALYQAVFEQSKSGHKMPGLFHKQVLAARD